MSSRDGDMGRDNEDKMTMGRGEIFFCTGKMVNFVDGVRVGVILWGFGWCYYGLYTPDV